jgi:hypothetical protein
VQKQIFDKYSRANLRGYAIWFNMYPGDMRAKWPSGLLTDSRVAHWWDEPKQAGTWLGERADGLRPKLSEGSAWSGEILWDAYLLYGAQARWDAELPTDLIRFGRTIVAGREALKAEMATLVKETK